MKIRLLIVLAASVLSLATSFSALAHHSFAAAYNMETPIEITGKIVNVRLTNPHSYFFLDVENDSGEIEQIGIVSRVIDGDTIDVVIDGTTQYKFIKR